LNRSLYEEAERHYSLRKHAAPSDSLKNEVTKIRDHIKSSLSGADDTIEVAALVERLHLVENENKQLKSLLEKLESRLVKLEGDKPAAAPVAAAAPAAKPAAAKKDDDDDVDLFGDDDEEDSQEAARIREERLKAYSDKKAKSWNFSNFIFI
jgi:ribosomal protein L12E/L44/L45/RPP1/RPP2